LKRFEHLRRRRPINTSAIICPQHRKARILAQMQEDEHPGSSPGQAAEHADNSGLNELSGRVIGCAFTVLNTLGAGFLKKSL
jgi:hypothetical protein